MQLPNDIIFLTSQFLSLKDLVAFASCSKSLLKLLPPRREKADTTLWMMQYVDYHEIPVLEVYQFFLTFEVNMGHYNRIQKEHIRRNDLYYTRSGFTYFYRNRVITMHRCPSIQDARALIAEIYPLLVRAKIPTRKIRRARYP